MARRKKITPEFVRAVREMVSDPDYTKRRYFHFKILALHCAEDFYDFISHERRMLAFKYWQRYSKRADWYYRKIDQQEFLLGR